MTLLPYPSPRTLLERYGLRPKHSWGQNFLGDANLLERIAAQACPLGTPLVIEIGAGLGHLTARLLERARRVIAIERDRDLAAVLREELGSHPGFVLAEANALSIDYAALAAGAEAPPPVVGNLPYQIASPLLFRLLEADRVLGPWTFLVQKEVAQRLTANPGGRDYGALTVHMACARALRACFAVHPSAFLPPPRVDSLLVQACEAQPRLRPEGPDARRLAVLIDAAFSSRRKTLRNSLRSLGLGDLGPELLAAGVSPERRAETLSPADFLRLLAALPQFVLATSGDR